MTQNPLTEYQQSILDHARSLVPKDPPTPWMHQRKGFGDEGMLAAGWTEDGHLLCPTRGERCAYAISLSVSDSTRVRDGGGHNTAAVMYAINIIKDITYVERENTSREAARRRSAPRLETRPDRF